VAAPAPLVPPSCDAAQPLLGVAVGASTLHSLVAGSQAPPSAQSSLVAQLEPQAPSVVQRYGAHDESVPSVAIEPL
jgi:hypothetical protein